MYHEGLNGETYNIGGFNEWKNIDLIRLLCGIMDEKLGRETGHSEKLITYVKDRPGHDRRYAIDASKIKSELGWEPSVTFEEGGRDGRMVPRQFRVAEQGDLWRIPAVLRSDVR